MRDDGLLLPAYLGDGEVNPGSKAKPDARPKPDPEEDDAPPDPQDPDAFGLSSDDWISLTGGNHEYYSSTAMLWWALAGVEDDAGPFPKTDAALRNFLLAIYADLNGLMAAARGSSNDRVMAIAGTLENACRRVLLAAEIAETLTHAEYDRDEHKRKRPKVSPPPKKRKKS